MTDFKLYNKPFHGNIDLSQFKFLITGGAGFIGSNLVEYLLKYNAGKIRILDNLSSGYFENIESFLINKSVEFIEGDIRDFETCMRAVKDIDFVSHQAALGSVPRSIKDPLNTNSVNISGFLNMIESSRINGSIKKFVYAASSSTYGDSNSMPKIEGLEGNPLSPYAVTKLVNEIYSDVYSKVYNFHTIGLRYFNVFGPKQNPTNPYAAVIPIFCHNYLNNKLITINGDGETSRDFTFVENAVQANIKALLLDSNKLESHQVFNVACGKQTSLNEILELLNKKTNSKIQVSYEDYRIGDIKHSLADISKIKHFLNYLPSVEIEEGLDITFKWYKNNYGKN
jgi:UDP-N-acetylglucosamine 4-epimerase